MLLQEAQYHIEEFLSKLLFLGKQHQPVKAVFSCVTFKYTLHTHKIKLHHTIQFFDFLCRQNNNIYYHA